jgi:hypothetical protein
VRHQELQGRQLLGRQMNHLLAAPQRPIGFQSEPSEAKDRGAGLPVRACWRGFRISSPAAWTRRRRLQISGPPPGFCPRNPQISSPAARICNWSSRGHRFRGGA